MTYTGSSKNINGVYIVTTCSFYSLTYSSNARAVELLARKIPQHVKRRDSATYPRFKTPQEQTENWQKGCPEKNTDRKTLTISAGHILG